MEDASSGREIGHSRADHSRSRSPEAARRMALLKVRGPHVSPPQALPGTGWWHTPLWTSLEDVRNSLPQKPTRKINLESTCSGMFSEGWVCSAFDIKLGTVICSDTKEAAQRFAVANHSCITHFFTSMSSAMELEGQCAVHKRICRPDLQQIDILVAGTPCQPFSGRRFKRGASASTGVATDHPLWKTTFSELPALLEARRPLCALFEQVTGFAEEDRLTGESPLTQFTELILPYFASIRVVELNAATWADISRPRLGCALPCLVVVASKSLGAVPMIDSFSVPPWNP